MCVWWCSGKESTCQARNVGLIPVSVRSPGKGNGNPQPTTVSLPGQSRGQKSLVGYSPWGHKELDMA